MPEGPNEQQDQKFTLLLSDAVPSFHPKRITEARTAQLQRVKASHNEHFTETEAI